MNIKNFLIILGLYIVVLLFLLMREYTNKKNSLEEIKENSKKIFFKVTIFFAVMIIMSLIFGLMGIKPD